MAIEFAICLRPRPAYRRPFGAVEHTELDTASIGRPAHHAIQRIDLPDQMSLSQTANGGIARHLTDGDELVGDQGRPGPEPGRGCSCLGAGMSTADDDHVECFRGRGHAAACG